MRASGIPLRGFKGHPEAADPEVLRARMPPSMHSIWFSMVWTRFGAGWLVQRRHLAGLGLGRPLYRGLNNYQYGSLLLFSYIRPQNPLLTKTSILGLIGFADWCHVMETLLSHCLVLVHLSYLSGTQLLDCPSMISFVRHFF